MGQGVNQCCDTKQFRKKVPWLPVKTCGGRFPFTHSLGLFYFVTVMFAQEIECSKYEMEMIVHDREKEALDSELQVKFLGSPLCIDVAEDELNFFVKIIYTHFKHIIRDMLL